MKKIIANIMLFIFGFSTVATSHAQWIVNDPIHTIQTLVHTGYTVANEIARFKQMAEQLAQLKSLGNLSTWKNKQEEELRALTGYVSSLEKIYGSIGAQSGRLRSRLDEASILKMDYQQYIQAEEKLVKEKNSEAIRRHDDDVKALTKTQKDYDDVRAWESQIDSITQRGSSQMMNQQLNKLVTQNSEMLKVMVANRMENREDTLVRERVEAQNLTKLSADNMAKIEAARVEEYKKLKSGLLKPPGAKN